MTKKEFLSILGKAYHFPAYYSHNLDSADEILDDRKEVAGVDKLSPAPLFHALLNDEPEVEREKIVAFLRDHFAWPEEE